MSKHICAGHAKPYNLRLQTTILDPHISLVSSPTITDECRRHVYVTPKSYMSFLDGFRSLYSSKLAETRELAGAINNGLQKMNGAKIDVNRMKVHGLESFSMES